MIHLTSECVKLPKKNRQCSRTLQADVLTSLANAFVCDKLSLREFVARMFDFDSDFDSDSDQDPSPGC